MKNRSQFNETFKFQVFSGEDEIAFQLRDDDKTKKYAQDNILGEYRAPLKEFIRDSGTEKWYKLTTQLEGWTTSKEAAQLSMTVAFTAKSKKQTEVYTKSKSEAEVKQFHANAAKQEQYVKEQQTKMQQAKDEVNKLTEQLALVGIAEVPEVPKNVGKSWPLNRNYFEKVKMNAPDLVKP